MIDLFDQVHCSDNLDFLRNLPDDSIDSIVTDPPYGLSFMGKKWDYDVPSVDVWFECLRVLKPGGHLLAFAGTRTQHRMAVNIEDAGFEIRDMIAWVYGSGFPKSHDVSKAIDKRGGASADFVEFRDAVKDAMKRNGISRSQLEDALGNFMLSHYLTAGSQPAIPNLRDYLIIRETVNLGPKFDELFNAEAERPVVGKSRWDNSASHFVPGEDHSQRVQLDITAPATSEAHKWNGWGTALKPALEPITVARKPFKGTVAENVLKHGTGGINIDGCRVEGAKPDTTRGEGGKNGRYGPPGSQGRIVDDGLGRFPANLIHDGSDEVVGLFPETKSAQSKRGNGIGSGYHGSNSEWNTLRGHSDSGSASRFFYCAKASKRDRDEGCEGLEVRNNMRVNGPRESEEAKHRTKRSNNHPTVKPTDLMRYLCRLVTPPDGIVLDPFAGSGSTGKAAVLEHFRFIGIERESEYCEIANARIKHAKDRRIMKFTEEER
jgi:DNA modification methylase